jgi:hypothetical protein
MTRFPKRYEYRDDNVPGWIYVLEAEGYHGIYPGCILRRVKIGLSRDVDQRLDTLHSNQPCCDYKLIKVIYVESMSDVETRLHQIFKNSNVKLKKSREYFDLYPWQMVYLHWLMSQHEVKVWTFADIPKRAIAGGLIALVGLGMLIGQSIKEPQVQPSVKTTEQLDN